MIIKPLHNNILIEPLSEEEKGHKTSSGILIPETADKEKPDQGTVIAIGPGKRDEAGNLIPVSVSVGQKVIFSKYGPDEVKINDKKYYIINEDNILAVIE